MGGGGCWRCLLLPPSVAAIVGKWWSARLISLSWKAQWILASPRDAFAVFMELEAQRIEDRAESREAEDATAAAAATNLTQRL